MVKLLAAEELEKMSIDDYYIKEYAFIKLNNKLVNVGKRKPGIERSIYYDDETPRPNINYDFFEYYNMSRAFGSLSNNRFLEMDLYLYSTNSLYYEFTNYREWIREDNPTPLNTDEKKQILAAVEILKKDYKKRLKTYYKKYSDKIYTHGYWANR